VIAAVVIGLPLIGYGVYVLHSGTFAALRVLSRQAPVLEDGAAALAGWALIVAGIAAMLDAGLSSIDRVQHAASAAARFASGVALLLLIAALSAHLVG
jgi:hypothetical protein